MGDRLLTNWLYNPYMEVRARRYRFRILNGSVSRYLKLALVDQNGTPVPFHMVANDGNIMEHAVAFDGTNGTQTGILPTQAIAERYDIVVDFSNFNEGDRLYFVNLLEHDDGRRPEGAIPLQEVLSGQYQAVAQDDDGDGFADEWVDGDPCVGKFMELRVRAYSGVDQSMDPADYVAGKQQMIPLPRPTADELANALHRTFEFGRSSGTDSQPWTVKTDGGQGLGMDPRRISAAPNIGDLTDEGQGHLEIWHIENGGGGWSHPVHVHFEEGIILSRGGVPPPEWEKWARKDVYRVGRMPDSTDEVVIAIRFREFAGTYMEHCHNTQHEDHAMLLRWDIENPGQVELLPTPIPTWDGITYVSSVALPTFRTGDPDLNQGGGGVAPVAAFAATPTSGNAPLDVTFTDLSSGDVDSWAWNFGDGNSSTAQNPTHTYVNPGVYTVSLVVSGASGSDTAVQVNAITVDNNGGGLVAAFSATPTTGDAPLDVSFTDLSTGATQWRWTFGDGAGSRVQNPSHTYAAAGTYTVTLTVRGLGAQASASDSIVVTPGGGTGGETLTVARAQHRISTGEWRVRGTSSVPGSVVTVHSGADLSGPVIGSATVAGNGSWTMTVRNSPVALDASGTVSASSTGGASVLAVAVGTRP